MPPKKSKDSATQVKGEEAEELVKAYLKEQYRPYSVTDLILNLHNTVNKANMTKVLETLTSKGDVLSKTYGKSVYYVYKEEHLDDRQNDNQISEEDLKELKEKVGQLDKEVRELTLEYQQLVEDPSNEEASKEIKSIEKEIVQLDNKLKEFSDDTKPKLSKEEIEKTKKYSRDLMNMFQQRKKIFNRFIGMIKESVEDFNKLMIEIGIDLDEVEEIKAIKL